MTGGCETNPRHGHAPCMWHVMRRLLLCNPPETSCQDDENALLRGGATPVRRGGHGKRLFDWTGVNLKEILLAGVQWDALATAVGHLQRQSDLKVAGPLPFASLQALHKLSPDVLLLSPGLPEDFIDSVHSLWGSSAGTPGFLLCTSYDGLSERRVAPGIDDFVIVPCSGAELEQRVRRLLARRERQATKHVLMLGKISIYVQQTMVAVAGEHVTLTLREYQLLKFLAEHPDTVFTREQLLTHVWGAEGYVGTRTVDVHVRRLREKLDAPGESLFRTVRNVGYSVAASPGS